MGQIEKNLCDLNHNLKDMGALIGQIGHL